jgi:hypothetical protein
MPATEPSRTAFARVATGGPFAAGLPSFAAAAAQREPAPTTIVTSSRLFYDQFVKPNPRFFTVRDGALRLGCLPRDAWPKTDLRARRVLFLLPTTALGDNVGVFLFLQALRDKYRPREIGVLCPASATDIYRRDPTLALYPLWIAERELKRFDTVIDVAHLEEWAGIATWPIDAETALLEAFGLEPSARFASGPRRIAHRETPRIAILPLASSPLRTIPIAATKALVAGLAERGEVVVHLNRYQRQGQLYREALGKGVRTTDGFATTGELIDAIEAADFAIFADSGPAHLSKLARVPGVTLYSSAPGEVLQGRFRHQLRWQIPFKGAFCTAPCGLAKLRRGEDGAIGCMGSLERPLEALPTVAGEANREVVDRLLLQQPVPCINSLAENPAPFVNAVRLALVDCLLPPLETSLR